MGCEPQPQLSGFAEAWKMCLTRMAMRLYVRDVRCSPATSNAIALTPPVKDGMLPQRWVFHSAGKQHSAFIYGPGPFGLDFIVFGQARWSHARTGHQLLLLAVDLLLSFHEHCSQHGELVMHKQTPGTDIDAEEMFRVQPGADTIYAHRRYGPDWDCRPVPLGATLGADEANSLQSAGHIADTLRTAMREHCRGS